MNVNTDKSKEFGTEDVTKLIFRLAPPLMIGYLIQAAYNIVDSYYIGQCSDSGLTALSIMFPVQLIISAIGTGTGVGINALISRFDGMDDHRRANAVTRAGTGLGLLNWVLFLILVLLFLNSYINISSASPEVRQYTSVYGYIVCIGSLPHLMDYIWTRILLAKGNTKVPMMAQFVGCGLNIVLDPLLIWGFWKIPAMGITGAAIATVLGQTAVAVVTGIYGFGGFPSLKDMKENVLLIYKTSIPSLTLQFMYTVYISGLNLILATFSDAAVTVLGLYFKAQSFFGIPIFGLQNCILPILSFNYAAKNWERCEKVVKVAFSIAAAMMCFGVAVYELFPRQVLMLFTKNEEILAQGTIAFRIIALSLIPSVVSLMMPIIFQAITHNNKSMSIIILRHIVLFVPIAWLLSHLGLRYVWFTFPITDLVTALVSLLVFRRVMRRVMTPERCTV